MQIVDQGVDLNGDNDTDDQTLHVYDISADSATNVGLAAGNQFHLEVNLVAFEVLEVNQAGTDLNNDTDATDSVVHVYDAAADVTANAQLATSGFQEAELDGTRLVFRVVESAQGNTDLNGDADMSDTVVHIYDASTDEATKDTFVSMADRLAAEARQEGHEEGQARGLVEGKRAVIFELLRTRFGEAGMDYKGYNIAIHELGHNVEQVFSLNGIDHWWLNGVPNNAFTEALAFVFQHRDLELLGLGSRGGAERRLEALDTLWSTAEIGGVALVDMAVWRFRADGTLDGTFNPRGAQPGLVTYHNAAGGADDDFGRSVDFDSLGNIVVAGNSFSFLSMVGARTRMVVWRLVP